MSSNLPQPIADALTSVAASRQVGIYHAELSGAFLRVMIEADGGVSHGVCTEFARALRDEVDTRNLLPEDYRLEVSSPGIERRLYGPANYSGAVGEHVRVRTSEGTFDAVVEAADESAVTFGRVDNDAAATRRVPYGDVISARVRVSDDELFARAQRHRTLSATPARSGPD